MKALISFLKRWFVRTGQLLAGWFLVIAGLIITPMPIPVGLIMVFTGLALLVPTSVTVRRAISRVRYRNRRLNARFRLIKPRLPARARHLIELTDPRHLYRGSRQER